MIPDTFEVSSLMCDPSKGKKKGDYCGLCYIGVSGGKVWIRMQLKRIPREQLIRNYIDWYYMYQPTYAGIEANSFQELYSELINNECAIRSIAPIPIHQIYNTIPKEIRIRRLGPYLRDNKFRFIKPLSDGTDHIESLRIGASLLYSQLKDFPNGQHDDGPDTLEMSIRLIEIMTGEQQQSSHVTPNIVGT